MDGAHADQLDLAVSAVQLDPVARLVGAFQDRHQPGDQAAGVVLEHEGERQADAGGDRQKVLEGRLDDDLHQHDERAYADAQPENRNHAQDRKPQAQRRALGCPAQRPAHAGRQQPREYKHAHHEHDFVGIDIPEDPQAAGAVVHLTSSYHCNTGSQASGRCAAPGGEGLVPVKPAVPPGRPLGAL